ncbi:hypothetical protein FRB99_005384 [Tulasnella sp. 403]|nr:hypothetical protein FRB99_005384 [Tulasnella sp. 403]
MSTPPSTGLNGHKLSAIAHGGIASYPRVAGLAAFHYPLTPSPSSPFRAHRHHQSKSRPKPYHRPTPDSQIQAQQLALARHFDVDFGLSPITPTSLSSSSTYFSSTGSSGARFVSAKSPLGRVSASHAGPSNPRTPDDSTTTGSNQPLLTHTESAPSHRNPSWDSSAPLSEDPTSFRSTSDAGLTHIPYFTSTPEIPAAPLVFSSEYIEAQLAKFKDGSKSKSGDSKRTRPSYSKSTLLPTGMAYKDLVSASTDTADANALSALYSFPYASAYVSSSGSQVENQSTGTTAFSAVEKASAGNALASDEDTHIRRENKSEAERVAEEERKQKYAIDLIESAIKAIHKIWPETREPEHLLHPGPVTSDGKLRDPATAFQSQRPVVMSSSAQSKKRRPRRKVSLQQMTPESSPENMRLDGRKRKLDTEEGSSDGSDASASKRRACGYGGGPVSLPLSSPRAAQPAPQPQQHHITLRLFVRELLRRSKTSCNTLEVALCYLDGIEETVKKLRDCLKLGIAFGTVAMSERGPYDEGMKDEGRIAKQDDLDKMQTAEDDDSDSESDVVRRNREWMPISPQATTFGPDGRRTPPLPPSHVLATHPLLDARRTFLAALVLATKFMQDKAYSNKAWAKLSGLAGKEVGRCERALGGALQWRLWVGKDVASGSVRGRSPGVAETEVDSSCNGDVESLVHGDNDPVAQAFMAEAAMLRERTSGKSGPAPVVAPAQTGDELVTRAVVSRARTWPLLESGNVASATPSFASTSTAFAQFVPSEIPSITIPNVGPPPSWMESLLGSVAYKDLVPSMEQDPCSSAKLAETLPTDSAVPPVFVHSPAGIDTVIEEIFNDCGPVPTSPNTVRMAIDALQSQELDLGASPLLPMTGTLEGSNPSPPGTFVDAWPTAPSFPFSFSVPQRSSQTSIASQPQQHKLSNLVLHQQLPRLPPLLHPQTAALRASAAASVSGSSSSPNSSSTFSSPEVLTPIHSRSSTLVDATEYVGRAKGSFASFGAKEGYNFVDKAYADGISIPALLQQFQSFQPIA